MWLDWLRPALVDATEAELIEALKAGQAQIWPGDTAAVVTQVQDGPNGRFLHVWLAGGDMAGVLALRPGIEAWARAMGCKVMSINGRAGWAKVLRAAGYEIDGDELRKPL